MNVKYVKKKFSTISNFIVHKRVHRGEKPYLCDVCQKSYAHSSALSRHNKTATHIEKIKNRNTNLPLNHSSIVECGNSIKEEDIKEEIYEGESVDDPLTIHQETEKSYVCEDMKEEINEKESVDDPLTIHQETEKSYVCKDMTEEINEKEIVDDPLTIQQEIESSNISKDIKKEFKEEESVDDPLTIQGGKGRNENDNTF